MIDEPPSVPQTHSTLVREHGCPIVTFQQDNRSREEITQSSMPQDVGTAPIMPGMPAVTTERSQKKAEEFKLGASCFGL